MTSRSHEPVGEDQFQRLCSLIFFHFVLFSFRATWSSSIFLCPFAAVFVFYNILLPIFCPIFIFVFLPSQCHFARPSIFNFISSTFIFHFVKSYLRLLFYSFPTTFFSSFCFQFFFLFSSLFSYRFSATLIVLPFFILFLLVVFVIS